FISILRPLPRPTLLPYTTLFRSRKGKVLDVSFSPEKKDFSAIDTVTLYINPKIQQEYYAYIIGLSPRRVIFNPGTENEEFYALRSEEHTSELQSRFDLVCRLLLE